MTFIKRSALVVMLLSVFGVAQAGVIEFNAATFSTSEISNPATITLKRTGDTTASATVLVTSADGTATAASDYTAVSITVSWAAGDAANKTISIPILDDQELEETETVSLSLSAVTGDTIGSVSTATLSITDYEPGAVQFTSAAFSVLENAGTASITLKRTGIVTSAATVVVSSANGTALAASDYTAVQITVSWAANDAAIKTITVPILDDQLAEGTETITLSLSNVTGDTIGAISTATLSIIDYEQGTLQFSTPSISVAENVGTMSITVSRTNGSSGAVTVNYATVNGTAAAPDFFTAATGTLTFAEGEVSKTIPITIIDNTLGQANKSFTVTLSTVTGGALLGVNVSTIVTILNDDLDFTPGLTKIIPIVANITQGEVISLGQNSPFNAANTLLATINRIPELTITSLVAVQSGTTGIVEIPNGSTSFHILPYSASKASSSSPAIFLNQDQSGRMVTDEGLQIEFQPAMANTAVLQSALNLMSLPKMTITKNGNLTVQRNQGPPPLDVDSTGKLVINNSFYDRFNLRPSITSSVAPAGSTQGVYLYPHPNKALPNEVYLQVVYSVGTTIRQQFFTTAPAIGSEFISAIQARNGSNVRFEPFGIIALQFNDQTFRVYADFIVRRVDPTTYTGATPTTGIFNVADANGDKLGDFKMVYSNGDEQYFFLLP